MSESGPDHGPELTDDQLAEAAAGDLNVLAVLMLAGSTIFSLVNWWAGTMGWIAVALTIAGTLTWSSGLFKRSAPITAFVKIGFGFSGLVAPLVGVIGFVIGLFGPIWGWAMFAGAVLYFAFSVLGLEIIERAYEAGVVEEI